MDWTWIGNILEAVWDRVIKTGKLSLFFFKYFYDL